MMKFIVRRPVSQKSVLKKVFKEKGNDMWDNGKRINVGKIKYYIFLILNWSNRWLPNR